MWRLADSQVQWSIAGRTVAEVQLGDGVVLVVHHPHQGQVLAEIHSLSNDGPSAPLKVGLPACGLLQALNNSRGRVAERGTAISMTYGMYFR